MLLPPLAAGGWLPLLPLPANADHPYRGLPLPPSSCAIEALRDTFSSFSSPPAATPSCSVATAGTQHLNALIGLHSQTLPLPYDLNFFLSVLLKDSFVSLVATIGGSVVGCVMAQLQHPKREVCILSLCVDPHARRQGVALRLLQGLATRINECFASSWTARLHVQQTNVAAFSLYAQLGFRIRANHPTYYRGARYGGAAAFEMAMLME